MKLQFDSVCFTYPGGVEALRDLKLTIDQGERVALVGENGAGKTTLAKHMNGLLRPTQGRVRMDGEDIHRKTVAQLARRVGYAFQNPDEQLFNNTVVAEVEFGPKNLGSSGPELEASVRSALEVVNLQDKASHHPYDLLPSERKLLGIASILAMNTPLLVLDEPTMGLDLSGVECVTNVLHRCIERGKTVILISHDLDFCAEHVDRYIIMADGRVQLDADIHSAFNDLQLLENAGLEAPQLARLARGLGMEPTPATVPAFLRLLEARLT
jgi:energy-coupling factor transport system ATP-binding protein